jgi:hypothetical protein
MLYIDYLWVLYDLPQSCEWAAWRHLKSSVKKDYQGFYRDTLTDFCDAVDG